MEPFLGWENLSRRSQDLEPAWTLSGSIYLIAPDVLREHRRFVLPGTVPMMVYDNLESIDIDTPEDWSAALLALESLSSTEPVGARGD
ncbi:hypothetical protein NWF32_14685 [Pseudomonas qingdaonensis]|jgi:CMP-N-acetylneuraminic acid synthetase|nr:hypothetical protein [Pseudomonas qingdaonensis]